MLLQSCQGLDSKVYSFFFTQACYQGNLPIRTKYLLAGCSWIK